MLDLLVVYDALILLPLSKMLRIYKYKLLLSVLHHFKYRIEFSLCLPMHDFLCTLTVLLSIRLRPDKKEKKKTLRAHINILTNENCERQTHTCCKCISCWRRMYIRIMGKETFNTFILGG